MQERNVQPPDEASTVFAGRWAVRPSLRPQPVPWLPCPIPGLPPADYVLRYVRRAGARPQAYGCRVETALRAIVYGEA